MSVGRRFVSSASLLVAFTLLSLAQATAGARPLGGRSATPLSGMASRISVDRAQARAKMAHARPTDPSTIDCHVTAGGRSNVNLDCDDPGYPGRSIFPNNEEDIEVDPLDPNHIIVSSNDYSSCCDQWYTTFDGGATWTTGDISKESDLGSGFGSDPVTAIDPVHGTAVHASLNIHVDDVTGDLCDWDVVASISTDGGITWDPGGEPVEVYSGQGCDTTGTSVLNDKEWIEADKNPSSPYYGRIYMTWTRFLQVDGVYQESPIWESHSDDGGYTWSEAQEISGSSGTYCTFQTTGGPGECDENQFSVPTVGPDGTVTVAFENNQHDAAWEPHDQLENQYMVVQSQNGGVSWSAPVHVVDMEDGTADYPTNVDGRQTLTGFQARLGSQGNVVADPATGRLTLVFSDNRNGIHDSVSPTTNTDVFAMTSSTGTSWSGPFVVAGGGGDQWFPWADVNPVTGDVGVLYHSRPAGNSNSYMTKLATGVPGGAFTEARVSDKASRARDSLWFRAGVNHCRHCATFFGDYIGLAYGSDGSANASWTDMRRFSDFFSTTGYLEDSFFARL